MTKKANENIFGVPHLSDSQCISISSISAIIWVVLHWCCLTAQEQEKCLTIWAFLFIKHKGLSSLYKNIIKIQLFITKMSSVYHNNSFTFVPKEPIKQREQRVKDADTSDTCIQGHCKNVGTHYWKGWICQVYFVKGPAKSCLKFCGHEQMGVI